MRRLLFTIAMLVPMALFPLSQVRGAEPFAPRVMIVSMFGLEAAPWLKTLTITHEFTVPGLSAAFPEVGCTDDGICQMTTDMGHANAAASVMALTFSDQFDLRQTYFLIAGIGGIDPDRGTIGSATWARYAVDVGIAHEIDARDMPRGWKDGYFGVLTTSPDQMPRLEYHSELFQLNEALLQKAVLLSKQGQLEDSDDVRAYRQHYHEAGARQPPGIVQCDTVTSDTWFAGPHLSAHARHWVALLTGGRGQYCTTQEEDNASMVALSRAAKASRVDLQRVAILRTGSDFDRPYTGQSSLDSLKQQLTMEGAMRISTDNLMRAGMPLVEAITKNWDSWREGVPGN
ncbi:MAG TPA: purine nucleoside permease [Steroidobacteraceae bacterium]|jgi:purine nucleoside permease|nr:purine nucleoside permease [Steroidobacteraceae bacterium]